MRSTGSSRSGESRSRPRPATPGPSGGGTTHAHSPTCSSGRRAMCGWRRHSRRHRCSRPEASARASRASAACSCARTRGARARGSTTGSARGAAVSEGMDEYYGRAMPGEVPEDEFVSASQLYARHALVLDDAGADLGEAAWHESDIVQRFPGGVAWYVVDAAALGERTPYGTVAEAIEVARAAGGDVRPAEELPFPLPASPKLVKPPFTAVRVYAAVTHTIGGLRVDEQARVLDRAGDAGRRLARGGRRRGRHLHRRLRQRARRRARLRPHRRRDRVALTRAMGTESARAGRRPYSRARDACRSARDRGDGGPAPVQSLAGPSGFWRASLPGGPFGRSAVRFSTIGWSSDESAPRGVFAASPWQVTSAAIGLVGLVGAGVLTAVTALSPESAAPPHPTVVVVVPVTYDAQATLVGVRDPDGKESFALAEQVLITEAAIAAYAKERRNAPRASGGRARRRARAQRLGQSSASCAARFGSSGPGARSRSNSASGLRGRL